MIGFRSQPNRAGGAEHAPRSPGPLLRLVGRTSAFAGVVTLVLAVTAGSASAHTFFAGSAPADGTVVGAAPHTVALDFSKAVAINLSQVGVIDANGHNYPVTSLAHDPRTPTRLLVGLPSLPPQTYRVSFAVRDVTDLHLTSGSVVFGVSTVPTLKSARTNSRGPDNTEIGLRWLARSGLAILLGAFAVGLLVVPSAGGAAAQLQRRLFGLAMLGALAASAGDTALLSRQATTIGPFVPTFQRLVSESAFGQRWLLGMALVAAVLVALWRLRRRAATGLAVAATNRLAIAGAALALAQAVAVATSSHVGGGVAHTPAAVALLSVHLAAGGAWVGGLVALVVILRRLGPARVAVLRSFSRVAATGLAVVVVTGLLLSGYQVVTVTALLTTWYGAILLAKVAVLGAVALLGLHHARLVRRRSASDIGGLRITLPVEAAGALIVVLLGAALGATAPARGPQFDTRPPAVAPSILSTTVSDLLLSVGLRPNRPGTNILTVDLHSDRRPAPPIGAVTVRLQRPGGNAQVIVLSRTTPGHFDGGAVQLTPGDLAVDISVDRLSPVPTRAALAWSVNSPDRWRQPTVVSNARFAPLAAAGAGSVAFGAFAVLLLSRWRSRRRRTDRGRGTQEAVAPIDVRPLHLVSSANS